MKGLKEVDRYIYEIPVHGSMRVPARLYISPRLLDAVEEGALTQLVNVASLPGIVKYAIGMPDIHWGYGFPIGGVAAFDVKEGVITPGGIGFDINCGVRLMLTPLTWDDVKDRIDRVLAEIFKSVPSGVGAESKKKLSKRDLENVLRKGAGWDIENGMGIEDDLLRTENGGMMIEADPSEVSARAYDRGRRQLGTLGAGNHFIEIQVVDKVFLPDIAEKWGLHEEMVVVMIHTGSRGLGHQVATDWVKTVAYAMNRYGIKVPDRQLAAVPFASPEGEGYFSAMAAAANFAWANRQIIMHHVRKAFMKVFGISYDSMPLLYDVAHNIGKIEKHTVDSEEKLLVVHRKGATRAFPAGRDELSDVYRDTGHPVLIPGDMESGSYVLVPTDKSLYETFGSAAHGAGRVLSRRQAIKKHSGSEVINTLSEKGIMVMSASQKTVAEEAPDAYKDLDAVIEVLDRVKVARKVSRQVSRGVVKG